MTFWRTSVQKGVFYYLGTPLFVKQFIIIINGFFSGDPILISLALELTFYVNDTLTPKNSLGNVYLLRYWQGYDNLRQADVTMVKDLQVGFVKSNLIYLFRSERYL